MIIHELQGYIQSIYLVEYDDKLMLLDSGCRCDVTVIKQFIEDKLNRPFTDLKLVVVTHMHPDHAGGADKLRKLSGCKIATGEFEKHWYSGLGGFLLQIIDIVLTYYVANRTKKPIRNLWYSRKLKPDLLLTDNDLLPGFEDWQVVKSVGHTDRDIALYHDDSKHIYVADTVLVVKGKFISPFPVHHPNQYRKTLDKYISLKPSKLMMAHSGITDFDQQTISALKDKAPKLPNSTSHFIGRYVQKKLDLKRLLSKK